MFQSVDGRVYENLIEGAKYRIKTTGAKRKKTLEFFGYTESYEEIQGAIVPVGKIMQFNGYRLLVEHIESIELVPQSEEKNKPMYPCPRCSGLGRVVGYEHVSGGRCYKCNGSGKVDGKNNKY